MAPAAVVIEDGLDLFRRTREVLVGHHRRDIEVPAAVVPDPPRVDQLREHRAHPALPCRPRLIAVEGMADL
jgi:hypothetical protein